MIDNDFILLWIRRNIDFIAWWNVLVRCPNLPDLSNLTHSDDTQLGVHKLSGFGFISIVTNWGQVLR